MPGGGGEEQENRQQRAGSGQSRPALAALLQAGQFDEVLAFVKDKLPPGQQNLPTTHLFLASAYAGKRDTEKAVEHYLAALQRGSRQTWARRQA